MRCSRNITFLLLFSHRTSKKTFRMEGSGWRLRTLLLTSSSSRFSPARNLKTLSFSIFFLNRTLSPVHSHSSSQLRSRSCHKPNISVWYSMTSRSPCFIYQSRVLSSKIWEAFAASEYVSCIASHTSFAIGRNIYVLPMAGFMELIKHR